MTDLEIVPVPPEPGLRPAYRTGEPAGAAALLGAHAAGIGYLLHWSRKLIPPGGLDVGPEVPFLADHVMTLPIHQDLHARHLDYLSRRFLALDIPPATPPR